MPMDTVLVVDDEKVIRDGCKRFLSTEGLSRADGGTMVRKPWMCLAREPVNVILCDLMMPVMGALEVLDEVSVQAIPDVPLIIITGHGTVANAVECMKKGAYDFVTKPFRPDHLTLVVRRASRSRPWNGAPSSSRRNRPATSMIWPWNRAAFVPS